MAIARANYLPAPHFFELNQACRLLTEAFGYHVYLVGSSLVRRDYRDVDVRCILPDAEYDRLFPGLRGAGPAYNAIWSLMCSSISLWLSQRTGLPVDFQIQRQTDANAAHNGQRQAIGIFLRDEAGVPDASVELTGARPEEGFTLPAADVEAAMGRGLMAVIDSYRK